MYSKYIFTNSIKIFRFAQSGRANLAYSVCFSSNINFDVTLTIALWSKLGRNDE